MPRAVILALVLAILALQQIASAGALQSAASFPSLPALVPHEWAVNVLARVSEFPLCPQYLRDFAASTALDDDRVEEGARITSLLSPGPIRADLRGRVLERRGDQEGAVREFVTAGDYLRVGSAVDALDRGGKAILAEEVQRELVARLQLSDQKQELAYGLWRLGQLEAENGEHARALDDYLAALRIEPLSETYLLGAANEALYQGRIDLAGAYFARVVQLDPESIDGHIGVGRVAVRLGQTARAQSEVNFVRSRDLDARDLPLLEREARARR